MMKIINDMNYKSVYNSKIGKLILISDGEFLTGLYFTNIKTISNIDISKYPENNELDIFNITKNWLDKYFNHEEVSIDEIPIKINGSDFSLRVWNILKTIPYGCTMTYGEIADIIAEYLGINKMSSQAVGQAIGKNPIPIIIPCHRVLGASRKLTGYSAGIHNKIALLNHENIDYKK